MYARVMADATLSDFIFVALSAIAGPLIDYSLFWPALRRLSQTDPVWARRWLWASSIAHLWTLTAFGAALWMANDRTWTSLGLNLPEGWRLWVALAVLLLLGAYQALAVWTVARRSEQRESLRNQLGSLTVILPHTRRELHWFGGVSVTAGFCEEFLYRGYFIWVFAPWLGWWGAAALSVPFFAMAHIYQGWQGVLRTAAAGAIFALVVAIFDSLWPAIALHILIDLSVGTMAWLVLRTSSASRPANQEVAWSDSDV